VCAAVEQPAEHLDVRDRAHQLTGRLLDDRVHHGGPRRRVTGHHAPDRGRDEVVHDVTGHARPPTVPSHTPPLVLSQGKAAAAAIAGLKPGVHTVE
jgi:hypothetical protein